MSSRHLLSIVTIRNFLIFRIMLKLAENAQRDQNLISMLKLRIKNTWKIYKFVTLLITVALRVDLVGVQWVVVCYNYFQYFWFLGRKCFFIYFLTAFGKSENTFFSGKSYSTLSAVYFSCLSGLYDTVDIRVCPFQGDFTVHRHYQIYKYLANITTR